ncbi:MAG TPA: hypothetical protein VF096_12205, partial [Azonexus sp.]
SLPSIGLTPTPTTTGGLALQLDSEQLQAALAAAPASTQAVLANATQAFATAATAAETQLAASATALPATDLTLLGTATPAAPSAADLLILTPPGPAAGPPATLDAAVPGLPPLTETLASAIALPADDALFAGLATVPAAATATPLTPTTTAPPATPLPAEATPVDTTAFFTPATAATVTPAASGALAADALAAEQRSTAASQALQTLLSDPRLRALDNLFDPAYAAVMAATRLSDFDTPRPPNNPKSLLADTIGPVSALQRARAIADYSEAAGEEPGASALRARVGSNAARHYWG